MANKLKICENLRKFRDNIPGWIIYIGNRIVETIVVSLLVFVIILISSDWNTAWKIIIVNTVPVAIAMIIIFVLLILANINYRISIKHAETNSTGWLIGLLLINLIFLAGTGRSIGKDMYMPLFFPTPTMTITPTNTLYPTCISTPLSTDSPVTPPSITATHLPTSTQTKEQAIEEVIRTYFEYLSNTIPSEDKTSEALKFTTVTFQKEILHTSYFNFWKFREIYNSNDSYVVQNTEFITPELVKVVLRIVYKDTRADELVIIDTITNVYLEFTSETDWLISRWYESRQNE